MATLPIQRNILLLKIFNTLEDFRIYAPIAIIYFSEVTGSYALGMSIFSLVMITQTLFELPMGVISDYIGRKRTVLIGSVCAVISVAIYALGLSYFVLLIGAVFAGLARTFFSGNDDALLYETMQELGREDEFTEVFGKVNSFYEVGLATSAVIGSAIVLFFPLSALFWITILPLLGCVGISFLIVEPKIHSNKYKNNVYAHLKEAVREFVKNNKLRNLSIASSINHGVSETMFNFMPAFIALVWPTWAIGIYRGLMHTSGFISYFFAGALIKRLTALKTLLQLSIFDGALTFAALLTANIFSPILLALSTLSFGAKETAGKTLMQAEFSEKKRATMGSLNAMFGSLLFAIISVGLGWFADIYGVVSALLLGQAILVIVILMYFRLFRRHS